jgi:hypothetical protein
MASLLEQFYKVDADVAFVARDKNFHGFSL